MVLRNTRLAVTALALLLACGCETRKPVSSSGSFPAAPSPAQVEAGKPPAPPIHENFEGEPKLSLFPRAGDYRPEDGDDVGLPFWRAYIEHVTRTSGAVPLQAPIGRGRVFTFRGVAGITSLGFFSPLAVEPETTYRVSALLKSELPAGASAGIGVLEYDQFLWISEQFPESLDSKHRTGVMEGVRLTGPAEWQERTFTFKTAPKTRMVHLVFFREGANDRSQVMVDEIRVEKAAP